jgi:hypothetical protein
MNTTDALKVSQKINALPLPLLQDVDRYIDFLNFKYADWGEQLTEIYLIKKGTDDILNNRIVPHEEAKEKIKNHIKSKSL